MTKKTKVPHPQDATSDEDHLKFAEHMIQQIRAGHYKASNVSVSRTDEGDAGARTHSRHFDIGFTINDVEPGAELHDL